MKKLFLYALIIYTLSIFYNKVYYQYNLTDSFKRTTLSLFTGTIYASNYSEKNFHKVHIGMPQEKVEELLGKPLRVDYGPLGTSYIYSNQDTPTADYDRRWISFNQSQQVDEIESRFYID